MRRHRSHREAFSASTWMGTSGPRPWRGASRALAMSSTALVGAVGRSEPGIATTRSCSRRSWDTGRLSSGGACGGRTGNQAGPRTSSYGPETSPDDLGRWGPHGRGLRAGRWGARGGPAPGARFPHLRGHRPAGGMQAFAGARWWRSPVGILRPRGRSRRLGDDVGRSGFSSSAVCGLTRPCRQVFGAHSQ